MNILGISAFYHDSAACLVQDGRIVSAAQEERFTRKKHDFSFPKNAINYCLQDSGLKVKDLDFVAFYDKPFLKFERILMTYLTYAPAGIRSFVKSMPLWIKQKIWLKELIKKELDFEGKIIFTEHHESHAASAFFPSPFQEAAVLTLDGVGEWATTSYGIGKGNRIELSHEIHFPHSLGLLYSAFTYYTGFKVNSGEYKVMGLAPYGEPKYKDLILKELIDVKEDGSFKLNMKYFNYCAGLTMTNGKFDKIFGGPPRKSESTLTQREMDLARSVQEVTEEIMMRMARHLHKETGMKNLCLAGGVALNCVANGRILREGPFEHIWIQPAAGDAGGALGAALSVWHRFLEKERRNTGEDDIQRGSFLGPVFSNDTVIQFLETGKYPFHRLFPEKRARTIAEQIASGKIVGYMAGRMEYGPRALGARSILGDPRREETQSVMNLKIKYRESFRPFAQTVLEERAAKYFEIDRPSPYMLLVADVKRDRCFPQPSPDGRGILERLKFKRSDIPAVTHLDYSARLQTVNRKDKPDYHAVISEFEKLTDCAVVVNTSFNVRGEPIVCTPEDAYRCFMRTEMDVLVIEDVMLFKEEQPPWKEGRDWREEFTLD